MQFGEKRTVLGIGDNVVPPAENGGVIKVCSTAANRGLPGRRLTGKLAAWDAGDKQTLPLLPALTGAERFHRRVVHPLGGGSAGTHHIHSDQMQSGDRQDDWKAKHDHNQASLSLN